MAEYTRDSFRQWLEALPQGESFCAKHNCPIAQFIGLDSVKSQWEDTELAWAIDDITWEIDSDHRDWRTLVPADVLDVLDHLAAQ